MQAVELLPAGEPLPEHVIERWVAAALAEAKAWRDLDDQLYPAGDDPARLERARQLHATWGQWAEQTGVLLERIAAYNAPALARRDVSELRQENAWARALVRRTPEMILQRLKRAQEGNVLTIEEARRELRTYHQP
jgi:hypothetical protein